MGLLKKLWAGLPRTAGGVASKAATAALGAAVALGVAWLIGQFRDDPPPIPSQLGDILRDAERDGLSVIYNREADLHGTGAKARLIVLRPQGEQAYTTRSDELRVYEEADDRLKLAFSFRPVSRVARAEVPYRLRFVATGRFDATDREQALLSLEPSYADTRLPRPIAVTWDLAEQAYDVQPLLRRRPSLPMARRGTFAASGRRLYKPIDIALANGEVLRKVGGTSDFRVRRSRIAAAYIVRQECNACVGVWEFKAWHLDFQDPRNAGFECERYDRRGRPKPLLMRVTNPVAIRRGLRVALRGGPCV
jgi:hypothetical protein